MDGAEGSSSHQGRRRHRRLRSFFVGSVRHNQPIAKVDPELLRTYQLFIDTWNEGLGKLTSEELPDNLVWSCQGRWNIATGEELPEGSRLERDDQYVVRSWMAVLTYLLSDYKFLYE